ncbi:hypothetical protein C6I21_05155 [Alkalicoccus urumqiensis]|uniref:Uncharacterized protein n=1 Tax=Alkalicoccus urumqiensis TaxID=1548213 RepID=A0A2P6MIX3_ALKUR|nr:hypothetical protein C6I21_05155 [Alkalicoccus urumqiensis]
MGRPAHWEYDNWIVKKSTEAGFVEEASAPLSRKIVQISQVTGMKESVLCHVFEAYPKNIEQKKYIGLLNQSFSCYNKENNFLKI